MKITFKLGWAPLLCWPLVAAFAVAACDPENEAEPREEQQAGAGSGAVGGTAAGRGGSSSGGGRGGSAGSTAGSAQLEGGHGGEASGTGGTDNEGGGGNVTGGDAGNDGSGDAGRGSAGEAGSDTGSAGRGGSEASGGSAGSSPAAGAGGTGGEGTAGTTGTTFVNGCVVFEDFTAPSAVRDLAWDENLIFDGSRCMKIQAGQSVTFTGDFDNHPLAVRGGDMPSPLAPSATYETPGIYGYYCPLHPVEMNGAIWVVP